MFNEIESAAWLLLAIWKEPMPMRNIDDICDGIMHARPTETERKLALNYLTNIGYVQHEGGKYFRTADGDTAVNEAGASLNYAGWKTLVAYLAR